MAGSLLTGLVDGSTHIFKIVNKLAAHNTDERGALAKASVHAKPHLISYMGKYEKRENPAHPPHVYCDPRKGRLAPAAFFKFRASSAGSFEKKNKSEVN